MGRAALLVFLFALFAVAACGGSRCPDMCNKVSDCQAEGNQPCDKTQCERICNEQRSFGGQLGFNDQLQCVIDTSCFDLSRNACFYTALRFDQWCVPVQKP